MDEEQMRVLEMIARGAISAEEGDKLLEAMQFSDAPLPESLIEFENRPKPQFEDEIEVLDTPPPKPNWAKFWAILVATGALLTALGLAYTILVFSGDIGWGWLFLILPALLVGGGVFLVGWFSRTSKWLHIRIKDGPDRVCIRLPLPLGWIGWSVKIARPFVPQLAGFAADELLKVLAESSPEGVFWIEVEETEGEQVLIYYG